MDDDELMFDLDSIPELFTDNYFENLGSFFDDSPNLRNDDGGSITFADNEVATIVEDMAHISPNVKNEVGKGDLGDIPELFEDDFFSDIESLLKFDYNGGHWGFLADNQCGKQTDLTDSCKIQMTSC
jgi:hypothetical protein